jgi:hypothetical protein
MDVSKRVGVRVTRNRVRALVSAPTYNESHAHHRAENNDYFHFVFGPLHPERTGSSLSICFLTMNLPKGKL